MSLDTWTNLQTEVASNANRSDLTALIPTFIQLAESEMQRELKLSELEASSSITMTAGVGTLPTGYAGARSLYWDGQPDRPLEYVTPDRFNALRASYTSGDAQWYTIQGGQLLTMPPGDGTVVMQYLARFTALSGSNASNAILASYPDAYFFGTLKWLYHHTRNWAAKTEQGNAFDRVLASIIKDQKAKKYPGPLTVRAA